MEHGVCLKWEKNMLGKIIEVYLLSLKKLINGSCPCWSLAFRKMWFIAFFKKSRGMAFLSCCGNSVVTEAKLNIYISLGANKSRGEESFMYILMHTPAKWWFLLMFWLLQATNIWTSSVTVRKNPEAALSLDYLLARARLDQYLCTICLPICHQSSSVYSYLCTF